MPDDVLKDAIETSRRVLDSCPDFETEGKFRTRILIFNQLRYNQNMGEQFVFYPGLSCAEQIKNEFDQRWNPHWHVIIGRNFGSFVTHEMKCFVFFYLGDKAVMMFKAG